jgi:membrane protease YdiL (CAAX protease family)
MSVPERSAQRRSARRVALTVAVAALAVATTFLVAALDSVWFDAVNRIAHLTDAVGRGLLFSSWLLVIGGAIVIWRPASWGLRLGETRRHLGLIAATGVGATVATIVILRLIGSTPYSDASLFIEAVDVPITEELVFRAVLLTVLLVVLRRLWAHRSATVLAIGIDAAAFGAAHLANLAATPTPFTIGQAAFATVLGGLCAFLMVRTRSVFPAMFLHAAVNATVVVAS